MIHPNQGESSTLCSRPALYLIHACCYDRRFQPRPSETLGASPSTDTAEVKQQRTLYVQPCDNDGSLPIHCTPKDKKTEAKKSLVSYSIYVCVLLSNNAEPDGRATVRTFSHS